MTTPTWWLHKNINIKCWTTLNESIKNIKSRRTSLLSTQLQTEFAKNREWDFKWTWSRFLRSSHRKLGKARRGVPKADCSAAGATPNATLCVTVTHTGRGGGCVTSQVPTPTSNKSYCADHQVFTLGSPSKLQTIPRSGTIIYSLSLGPQISLDPVPNHKIISPKINLGNLLLSGLHSLQAPHHIALFLFLRRHHFLQYPLHSASDNYFYQTDYPISTKIRQSKVVSQETEKTCGSTCI